jgi:DNA-binding Xre family transcriptional regulator
MRKDVELDQALQEHDVRFKELEQSLTMKSSELDALKDENKKLRK